jgi:hypothetical protein
MKIKTILSLLLSFSFYVLSSQVPQGMNYQAIARDGTGNPITGVTLQVKIGILSDTITPVVVWEELHSTVKTNAFGMFTLVIGSGTRQSGSALSFSDIDWTVLPLYLKTQIFYQGSWKYMGTSILWAVPYSMVAGNLGGSLKNLEVVGDDVSSDEALFEVKRKDGQTMFAVYNHGVRVYMPLDTLSKARKGGFAIGGFDKSKGTVQDYFVVNPDSIRAYIDTNTAKGRKGGFAIGGFDKSKSVNEEYLRVTRDSTRVYLNDTGTKSRKGGFAIGGFDRSKADIQDFFTVSSDSIRMYIDDNLAKSRKGGFAIGGFDKSKGTNASFFNVFPDSTGTVDPSENRILWYPLKNAFLTGKVLIEKSDSVGENSFASGFESKATGGWSQALGYKAIARGDYSTAIGKNAIANNIYSFALGENAKAKNNESYAFGRGAIAEGFRSFAFGSAGVDQGGTPTGVAYAKGIYSFAIGQGSQSLGGGSFTFGLADTAKGDFSTAIGFENSATAYGSFASGYMTTASEAYATSMGSSTHASGFGSTAMGNNSKALGMGSVAMGNATVASMVGATAMGGQDTASGGYSTAMGYYTRASGDYSLATGYMTHATGSYSLATGNRATTYNWCSVAMGYGTTASGSESLATGYNTTASGEASSTLGFYTKASGYYSIAAGFRNVANTFGSLVIGQYNDTSKYHGNNSYNNWYNDDPVFVIGNGSGSTRSNALTVIKNGRVGLQTVINPAYALELPNNSNIGVGQARAYAWATYSDGRAKSEQTMLSYGLNEIMNLEPAEYIHHSTLCDNNGIKILNEGKHDIGLIAQQVYNIIPEAVNKPENEDKELWSISYDKLIPVLVNAIKEQQQQIESYKSRLQSLQEEVAQIKEMLGSEMK